MDIKETLARIGEEVRERFDAQKRVLDFTSYLTMVQQGVQLHTRDATRYLLGAMDHYGTSDVERPWGTETRFDIFDCIFGEQEPLEERRRDHLVGHEGLQAEIHRTLLNFSREGRANRLILLHGPNGSAKSTLVACLMRGLEAYSKTPEGALYSFAWVFPRGSDGKGIGFGSGPATGAEGESYANLPEDRIDLKMISGLREHPLLLLPKARRRSLIRSFSEAAGVDVSVPDWIWNGSLGHKNRQIFEALLTAYRGDLDRVLAHVRVERFYISRRYRRGAVTIGPQMHVDASEQQVTSDRSLAALPASLSALTLYDTHGELVDASGGMVEFSDLLKRPLETWKYLLLAIENGEIALRFSNIPLNLVMIASSNELHLNAFKEHPEYNSFRGRLHLIRAPYLLDYAQEQDIYDAQIVPQIRRPVAPHTTYVAALWAVLTRLRRPESERYESELLGKIAASLSPFEKAELYSAGELPSRLSSAEARELHAGMRDIHEETRTVADYEGLTGASPREIRTLLLDVATDEEASCVAPPALLRRIGEFCERRDFEFLSRPPEGGYHDHEAFLEQVEAAWLDRVESELRNCSGLIDEEQYLDLFRRYVTQVSFWLKGERVYNQVTGKSEDPDFELMKRVEEQLAVEDDPAEFRRSIINVVAAHAIDNPDGGVDHVAIFPQHVERLKEGYFHERREQITLLGADILTLLTEEGSALEPEAEETARAAFSELCERFGYVESTARVALGELIKRRSTS